MNQEQVREDQELIGLIKEAYEFKKWLNNKGGDNNGA